MQDITLFIQNHTGLVSALVFALLLLMLVEFVKQKVGAKRLNPSEATQLINRQDGVVVDIRPKDVFKDGHIAGAQSLPMADFEKKSSRLDNLKLRPIILVCNGGLDSNRAATMLMQKGINPYILEGGIKSWREAELPLVKG